MKKDLYRLSWYSEFGSLGKQKKKFDSVAPILVTHNACEN